MIQAITTVHIPQCVNVIRESFLTVAKQFNITEENAPRFTAFATTADRLQWQLNIDHRPMYAFFEQGRIVGYYSLHRQSQDRCELNNLCVLPAYRHQGIGQELLKHAFATARSLGCTQMHIGIVEENSLLRSWYEEFGFVHTRTEKYDFFPFTCGYMEMKL